MLTLKPIPALGASKSPSAMRLITESRPKGITPTEQTKKLERERAKVEKQRIRQERAVDYDSLDSLSISEPDSHSFVVEGEEDDDGPVQDLAGSDEEDDYSSSSTGKSQSIEEEEEEEQDYRLRTKKRKVDTTRPVISKSPRSNQKDSLYEEQNKEKLNSLANTITLNIEELERINAVVLENMRLTEQAIARLDDKEKAQLFVLNQDKVAKEQEAERLALKQRTEELQLAVDAANKLEAQLIARANEANKRENELALAEASFRGREEQLAATEKKYQEMFAELERKEKALPAPSKPVAKVLPLEGFLAEMHKSGQNMLSKEDMCGIVSTNLMCSLAYMGGKQQLKYHSLHNSQFLIVEVTQVESGQLLMRQIVSKQLYTAK